MDVSVRVFLRDGDLFEQDCDVFVNPYNRNLIPWWLLIPGGVSGELKRRAGTGPFRELGRHGTLQLGQAVLTGGGRLGVPVIHVAGLNHLWRATPDSVSMSARAAVVLAAEHGLRVVAMPLIGAGHGGLDEESSLLYMRRGLSEFERDAGETHVLIIRRR